MTISSSSPKLPQQPKLLDLLRAKTRLLDDSKRTEEATSAGGTQGDYRHGPQAGADRVPPASLRRSLCQAGRTRLLRAGTGSIGEEPAPPGQRVGLRFGEEARMRQRCVRDEWCRVVSGISRPELCSTAIGGARSPHTVCLTGDENSRTLNHQQRKFLGRRAFTAWRVDPVR